MKTYKQLTELNRRGHPSTGQIICYAGYGPWNAADDNKFIEISSCDQKIRLHKVGVDSDKQWIAKMKKLRDAVDKYIQFLETQTK